MSIESTRTSARALAVARFAMIVFIAALGWIRPVEAGLASCPAGQEPVYYYGGGSLAWYSTHWSDCVKSKIGTSTSLALGKTSKADVEAAIASCDAQYTSTWENPIEWGSWNGKRNFEFCHCTDNPPYGGLPCFGKQWRSDSQEYSCPSVNTDPYYANIGVDTGCRIVPATLSLQAGGQTRAGQYLFGQRLLLMRNGQPVPNMPVEIGAQPGNPGIPDAVLQKAQGEGANCTTGSVMNCTTDADGAIDFTFYVPEPGLDVNTNYSITARCTDLNQACTPAVAGPAEVNILGCPIALSLDATGQVREGIAGGLSAQVSRCGEPVSNVAIRFSTWPQDESERSGTLYPEPASAGLCLPGTDMDCTTDEAGRIAFAFDPAEPRPRADKLHYITAICTDPAASCTPEIAGPDTVTVEGCHVTLEDFIGPDQMEPGSASEDFVVIARDCQGVLATNYAVDIAATVQATSGGHTHADPTYERPRGHFSVDGAHSACTGIGNAAMRCTTNGEGKITFAFLAPAPAGTHEIKAQCAEPAECAGASNRLIDAKVGGLAQIPSSSFYTLTELFTANFDPCRQVVAGRNIGDNHKHDGLNHFLTSRAAGTLHRIGYNYAAAFEDPYARVPERLHINDASLELGGVFDYKATWAPPHNRHRRGTVVDIRANTCPGAIPDDYNDTFTEAASEAGAVAEHEYGGTPNEHFHVLLRLDANGAGVQE